ncbi:MAG: family 10 glycosylhydrolase [bacterium]
MKSSYIKINSEKQINLLIIVLVFLIMNNPIKPQEFRETRAVWLATNYRLDWPPPTFDQKIQIDRLTEIMDDIKDKNLNTVFFQVRSNGTVMFKSSYEPFSSYFTGQTDNLPDYDPLELAINLAHKRGLELHAWLNVTRSYATSEEKILNHPKHLYNTHPNWLVKYFEEGKTTYWIDPGLPEARTYIADIVAELVLKYDVDGIHLDFIRYPGKNFDDDFSYKIYGEGLPIDEFRRNNITDIVRQIHDRVKSIKPFVKIGAAPIGIYKNIEGARGWEGYFDIYQDSRKWLELDYADYLAPQIYWGLDDNPRFDLLAKDWKNNSSGKSIILGIAAYKPEVKTEMESLINYSREVGADGVAFFRYENISNYNFLAFDNKAYPSAMPWIDNYNPNPPGNLQYEIVSSAPDPIIVNLTWDFPKTTSNGNGIAYYALYKMNDPYQALEPKNLYEIFSSDKNRVSLGIEKPRQTKYYFTLKSVDKLWNESENSSNIIELTIDNLENISSGISSATKSYLVKEGNTFLLMLASNTSQEIEVYGGNGSRDYLLMTRELSVGRNILFYEKDLSNLSHLKIKYKKSGKEEVLNL